MKLSLKAYVRYLRKQQVHVQKVHAIFFAALLTVSLAAAILYVEYDFWDEAYVRKEVATATSTKAFTDESPGKTLERLFTEGGSRFQAAMATLKPFSSDEETFIRSTSTVQIDQ